jgi:transposase
MLRPINLEELVGEDHPVRVVWAYVEEADLSALYASIKAVEGRPGRAATDPKILLALWMFATLDGVGSARALDRLCRDHGAYQWICGGVGMNAHTLSDFRVDHEAVLDQLLTQGVAARMVEQLVTLNRVAQDGTRVRASAGAASFRRLKTLKESLRVARQQVRRLRAELDQDPGATSRRQQAAQERAASDRLERVRRALRRLPEMAAKKKGDTKAEARASTTDPSATVMKMADGGFRPAYNVHLCTDTASQVIVGVEVSTAGNDQGEMLPMLEQLRARYGQVPQEILVDSGYVKKDDFDRAAQPVIWDAWSTPRWPSRGARRQSHSLRRRATVTRSLHGASGWRPRRRRRSTRSGPPPQSASMRWPETGGCGSCRFVVASRSELSRCCMPWSTT